MIGMDRTTGRALSGTAHLVQSAADVLTTPIGSVPMQRDYGSELFELIDAPANALTRARVYAATAMALGRWEPRLRLTRVSLSMEDATWPLTIEGDRLDVIGRGDGVRLTIPLRPVTS